MLKRTTSLSLTLLCATALLATGSPALATWGFVKGKVIQTLVTGDDRFGGCMAALSESPDTVLEGCAGWWVTFSCSGHFTDKVRAYRMLDQAQLAQATGKKVYVWFQDDKKHNGYCYANRIDVLQ